MLSPVGSIGSPAARARAQDGREHGSGKQGSRNEKRYGRLRYGAGGLAYFDAGVVLGKGGPGSRADRLQYDFHLPGIVQVGVEGLQRYHRKVDGSGTRVR